MEVVDQFLDAVISAATTLAGVLPARVLPPRPALPAFRPTAAPSPRGEPRTTDQIALQALRDALQHELHASRQT